MLVLLLVALVGQSSLAQNSGCGGESNLVASGEVASISSPNYPSPYSEDLSCRWVITSANDSPIELSFDTPFNLEHGVTVCYDYINIYKGSSASDGVMEELCGEQPPPPIHHPASSILVTFTSDYANQYEGFRMNYWTKDNSTKPPPTTTTGAPTTSPVCGSDEFHCTTGDPECIPSGGRCDGNEDCSDGSDERNCNLGDCGQPAIPPHTEHRIVNGEEATPHSFPWMVSIKGEGDPHYCGAALISPSWVLTAAHCAKIVFIGTFSGDVVVVGEHDRNTQNEEGRQTIKIAEKFSHPQYDTPDRAQDVALLKLETPAVLGPTVSLPCLPGLGDFGDSSNFPAGMECILSGWGKTGPGEGIPGDIYGQPWKLRQALLPLVDDQSCSDIYLEGAGFSIQPTMQCAGGAGQTSCNGDSGGPLVCNLNGIWHQIGIVSFGPSPCDSAIPAVYTRVAGFVDWIDETIEANGGWN